MANKHQTSTGGKARGFPNTTWGLILLAEDDEQRQECLNQLFDAYWKPVYLYIRYVWRKSNEESKDLAQGFFAHLLESKFWARVHPTKGRFRAYLKSCLRNYLMDDLRYNKAKKRGGGEQVVSLDHMTMPIKDPRQAPQDVFDREWARVLLNNAIEELKKRLTKEDRLHSFDMFRLLELEPLADNRPSYADLAAQFEVTREVVRTELQFARRRLRKIIQELIQNYCESEADVAEELRTLFPE